MNEAANYSARVSGQDRKELPALGTNQIAGSGGFRPLASLEKNKYIYYLYYICFVFAPFCVLHFFYTLYTLNKYDPKHSPK